MESAIDVDDEDIIFEIATCRVTFNAIIADVWDIFKQRAARKRTKSNA
jgi:hypothetical protein